MAAMTKTERQALLELAERKLQRVVQNSIAKITEQTESEIEAVEAVEIDGISELEAINAELIAFDKRVREERAEIEVRQRKARDRIRDTGTAAVLASTQSVYWDSMWLTQDNPRRYRSSYQRFVVEKPIVSLMPNTDYYGKIVDENVANELRKRTENRVEELRHKVNELAGNIYEEILLASISREDVRNLLDSLIPDELTVDTDN